METGVLIAGEQVQQGAFHTAQAFEVSQPGRVNVDAADALPLGLQIAYYRLGAIEPFGAATQAAAHVKVLEDVLPRRHAASPASVGLAGLIRNWACTRVASSSM
ncbi:hypothetical protein D3C77_600410 [compost metagenome]